MAALGDAADQEAHVKNCLEGGSGSVPQAAKYLVYKLPAESTLVGVECVICLEEFVQGPLSFVHICNAPPESSILAGSQVARLSCLCSFHNGMSFHPASNPNVDHILYSLPFFLVAAREELSCSCTMINQPA